VVVHHFDLLSVAVPPHKADPILVVDPYAVLPTPISSERLEVVARERTQIVEALRSVKLHQLALGDTANALKSPRRVTLEQGLCVPIPERPDHLPRVLRLP
jgi:hypothetical protein